MRIPTAHAYITVPVATLGQLAGSTYVTVMRVEKVSHEKGIILFRKVRDLKGTYPKDTVRHVFDLKNTPAHKGAGDVPIRPNEKDWSYAVKWAAPGKTAILFTKRYDPFGDFGHTYIEGCWYASMCPPRDWEFWYAIYAEPNLLNRWHCGSTDQLIAAVERMNAGKEAILPVLGQGTKDDLRLGKAKFRGIKVSPAIGDYNPGRDLVTGLFDNTMTPTLIQSLRASNREERLSAARSLGVIGLPAKAAIPSLAELVRNDMSGSVRIAAAEALMWLGPDAKTALPALDAALKDPRIAQRKDVIDKVAEVAKRLR